MVNPKARIKFTYEDYKNTPEDKRYELLDGDLVVVPAPKEFWLVDPEASTIEVLALGEGGFEAVATYEEGQALESPQLEGLSLNLDEVF